MIGVYCLDKERVIAREFFELFKTPWEYFVPGQKYEVILSTQLETPKVEASLIILYSSAQTQFDTLEGIDVSPAIDNCIRRKEDPIPVYGIMSRIEGSGVSLLNSWAGDVIALQYMTDQTKTIRVGFDLFREISTLLAKGQHAANAASPTLEAHIALLREWIVSSGIPLVEIPPVPFGRNFFACLTHDVDFTGIRKHKFDRTMWGFLYRGLFGSLKDFFEGKVPLSHMVRNWLAVFKLPFVFIGIADDVWEHFDRYTKVDPPNSSTFFLIPYKNTPGSNLNQSDPSKRAADYGIADVKEQVDQILSQGGEIGLHGIDAWHSDKIGLCEKEQALEMTGASKIGVRIHWLCYDDRSPVVLEKAGFDYDASLGFNEAIGFRNGTTQAFKPAEVDQLLELPLNIQDTSLFYPQRLHLKDAEAHELCIKILDSFSTYGGALTISWHERSLVPERLWGDFYIWLLKELEERGAWFARADQVVNWFRSRRSIRFEECCWKTGKIVIKISGNVSSIDPQMIVRVHMPFSSNMSPMDFSWNGEYCVEIPVEEKELA